MMTKYKTKNKKAQMLNQETVLVIVSIILIGLVLFFSLKYVKASRKDFEMTPSITYQFPAVYIHSFLEKEITLTNEEKKELKLNKNKYKINELISINNDKINDEIIAKYRKEFNKENKIAIEKYSLFSGETEINTQQLLYIDYDKSTIPDLENEICNNNYFFYFKNQENNFAIIYFKSKANNKNICDKGEKYDEPKEELEGEGETTQEENIGKEGA